MKEASQRWLGRVPYTTFVDVTINFGYCLGATSGGEYQQRITPD